MNKLKKILIGTTLISTSLIMLTTTNTFASTNKNLLQKTEYTEEFKNWLNLTDEEKKYVIQPRMYEIENTDITYKNPFYKARSIGTSQKARFSLKDIISSNLSIRNQQDTQSCWAFASLSSLETNLALSNYKRGVNTSKIYDYSERHMVYSTSKTFNNNVQNPSGYNKEAGDGGNWYYAESYLTNGSGAIDEASMPFENNENTIDINQIQNKPVTSQLYDTVYFPNYRSQTAEKKEQTMNKIKQHIQNYGSVTAYIHGASSSTTAFNCYNNDTGAKYCNSSLTHKIDHAVSIIGWDDNYSVENFATNARPKSNGAWIVRNSWGEKLEYNLLDLKNEIFTANKQQCIANGWNSADAIPNSLLESNGYTIENDKAYMKIGDNGLIYVSYEDRNISSSLYGIEKASDSKHYDNIYQYNEFYPAYEITISSPKVMLYNIFDKKTSGSEYLTQISINAPETYTCKVYVNPNGTSVSKKDLQLVELKTGESETFDAGYHTLEFNTPVKINANSFAVVVEVQSAKTSTKVSMETKLDSIPAFNSVTTESGKCFIAFNADLSNCTWIDLSKISEQNSSISNGDSTIKAFTTNQVIDNSLKNIEIVTPPTKTSYFEGENFDKTGMVIKANYNNNTSTILDSSSYNITNGTNLKSTQNSVTITYDNKSVNQPITVEKNSITELIVKTPPTKTQYKEGQNFDKTGMVIQAKYKNGTITDITNYTIENGNNLKANQKSITISYNGIKTTQAITVTPNPLVKIEITKAPTKTKYVVGQDFDKTGMIVTGTFEDETTQEISDYTIENGSKLTKSQTFVTISYNNKTVNQSITVEEKSITSIEISKKPTKLQYTQNKDELDLAGGQITLKYNDGTTENIDMTSDTVTASGFDNTKIGKQNITISYSSLTTTLEVEIIAEEVQKPENSDLTKLTSSIIGFSLKYDSSKTDDSNYLILTVEIKNLVQNTNNDSIEYYYYLSTNKDEKNIEGNWVKITDGNFSNDTLQFTIDSRNVPNYNELSENETLYIYIKEVAIKGGSQSISISDANKLEFYINTDSNINNNTNGSTSDSNDNTTANGKLPNAGLTTIIISMIITISGIGILIYVRYKNLSKYIK